MCASIAASVLNLNIMFMATLRVVGSKPHFEFIITPLLLQRRKSTIPMLALLRGEGGLRSLQPFLSYPTFPRIPPPCPLLWKGSGCYSLRQGKKPFRLSVWNSVLGVVHKLFLLEQLWTIPVLNFAFILL